VYSEYDTFAQLYDRHWGSFFTNEALGAFDAFVSRRLPPKAKILDLCCGTGQLASALASRGYAVTGIDGSREMLRFARKNAPNCKFILGDARDFDQGQSFDAVVSAFDSLNHITKLHELRSAFRHTRAALKEGGVFLFDMIMDEHFRRHWHGSFGIVEDSLACVVRSSFDEKRKAARMDIAIFSLGRATWTRSDLVLIERSYAPEAIDSALGQAGFVNARRYDPQKELRIQDVGRTFFVCERPT
jgi:SAM-dependent methyltransferase